MLAAGRVLPEFSLAASREIVAAHAYDGHEGIAVQACGAASARRGAVAIFTCIPSIGQGIYLPKSESEVSRSPVMDEQELRALAAHYKRVASLYVIRPRSVGKELLELASKCEAMAESLRITPARSAGMSRWPPGVTVGA